jgi:homoserine O-acetyltransferase
MIIRALFAAFSAAFLAVAAPSTLAQTSWPNQQEGDFLIKDFRFKSGETIAELKLHYTTLGTPRRNAAGDITNAVILLHGTSSDGKAWLIHSLADELFSAGAPLDAAQYFIVLPDGIGRGGSSKPSDGLRANFPHYRYDDIVASEHQLITEGLGIKHLRLVMGSSMGGMHTWMWGYMYPDLMDGLIPIASQPIQISGRNWGIAQRRIHSGHAGGNGGHSRCRHLREQSGGNRQRNLRTVRAQQDAMAEQGLGSRCRQFLLLSKIARACGA